MELQTLKATCREQLGKGATGRLRKAGALPAVLYGGGGDPVSIAFDEREFEHMLRSHVGEHAVLQVEVDDRPDWNSPALIQKVQHHPLRGTPMHVDLLRIRLDQRITTQVRLELTGHAHGIRDGGVLDHQMRELEVECLALDMPEVITLDITELNIGDTLHVADVTPPENVAILTDPARAVVAVLAPRLAEEAVEGEGEEGLEGAAEGEGAPAEPEVIGEKKDEE